MPTVKVFKLSSGDEIIGMVDDDYPNSDRFSIREVLSIVKEYNKRTKSHQVFLIDWLPGTVEDSFEIPKNHVVIISTPTFELEEHYLDLMERPGSNKKSDPLKEMLSNHRFDENESH